MESLVFLLHWIFNHLCLREIKGEILLFKIRVQPSPHWLFSLKCADWLNYIFLAFSEFDICKLRRYTIAAEIDVLPKVSGGLVWTCSFPPCSVQPENPALLFSSHLSTDRYWQRFFRRTAGSNCWTPLPRYWIAWHHFQFTLISPWIVKDIAQLI